MSRRTSMPSSSSPLLPASCLQQTATNRQLPLPQPAILFPQPPPIPHQQPTNNHTIAGNTSTSSPHLLSLCQNSPKLHRHFHPPSAAHHATGVPRHLLAPLPPLAPASQIHAQAHQHPLAVPQASTAQLPLQYTHFQSDHHRHSLKPCNNTLPQNPFSLFPRPLAGLLLTAHLTRQHPQWHHQQPLLYPLTRGQHVTPFHHSNPPLSSHHRPALPPRVHHPRRLQSAHPRSGWTRKGAPCRYHNRTTTQTPTRGMQITIDHAAAAPEAPAMIPPKMTCTTCYHHLSFFGHAVSVLPQLSNNIPTTIFGQPLSLLRGQPLSVSLCTTKNSAFPWTVSFSI